VLRAERERAAERVAGLEGELAAIVESAALSPPDDEHDPEGTTIGFERALISDLLGRARKDLADVAAAIDRLARGEYGRCRRCGRPIAAERLAVHPTATTCLTCAQASAAETSARVRRTL
jgi:DnaK suppressor protein